MSTATTAPFTAFWHAHMGDGDTALEWHDELLNRYSATDRHYHNLDHLNTMVAAVHAMPADLVGTPAEPKMDFGVVCAAIAFHKAVYQPKERDSIEKSCVFASAALLELGFDTHRRQHAVAAIAATASHASRPALPTDDNAPADDLTLAAVCAADLYILGATPPRYLAYCQGLRKEYSHLPALNWASGRLAMVQALWKRDALYDPRFGWDDREAQAKRNLASEAAVLSNEPTRL